MVGYTVSGADTRGGDGGYSPPPLADYFFIFYNKNIINTKRVLLKMKWAKSEEF